MSSRRRVPEFALSLRQPWAWAVIRAGKDVENRTWQRAFRGPLLVHASQRFDRQGYDWIISEGLVAPSEMPAPSDFLRGGILGATVITGVVTRSRSRWFFGPYAFTLDQRRTVAIPFVPCGGMLGFFRPDLTENQRRRIRDNLRRAGWKARDPG